MQTLVTGAAGFIGSHLAERLLAAGHAVRAVDAITPYYPRQIKRDNLLGLLGRPGFEFVEADLRVRDVAPLLAGVDAVFHLAAEPGLRHSWAGAFAVYEEHNILATQRLLEAAREVSLDRFVYASSSSVYGNEPRHPTAETDQVRPHSPYGVTKLAAEHLCGLYCDVFAVPTVVLRYFSVFGPRQRPDMAIHRMIESGLQNRPFTLFGTGEQVRDVTYVDDVVRATIAAATADVEPGAIVNIAGGASATVNELITTCSELLGNTVPVTHDMAQPGEVDHTGGDATRARELLAWKPEVTLHEGLEAQVRWQVERRRDNGS